MKKNLFKLIPAFSIIALFPNFAFAADSACSKLPGLTKILCQIKELLNATVPVLVALGLVYFVWGVVRYVIGDEEEAKKKGKDIMIFGIIGLAVIIGMWGLVNIVVNTFFSSGDLVAPALNTVGGGTGGSCSVPTTKPTLQSYLTYMTCIINSSVIPLLFAGAMAMFVWGIVNFFLIGGADEAKRTQGKQFMIWGVVALAAMVSIWGLVNILGSTFIPNYNGSLLPKTCPPGASDCP